MVSFSTNRHLRVAVFSRDGKVTTIDSFRATYESLRALTGGSYDMYPLDGKFSRRIMCVTSRGVDIYAVINGGTSREVVLTGDAVFLAVDKDGFFTSLNDYEVATLVLCAEGAYGHATLTLTDKELVPA